MGPSRQVAVRGRGAPTYRSLEWNRKRKPNYLKQAYEELTMPEDKYPAHLQEFGNFLDAKNAESQRGGAIISCAYLEKLLGEVLESFLLQEADLDKLMRGYNAPLGSLASRIDFGRALGVISSEEAHECHTLRRVRNYAAHDHNASFEDQKVIDLCKNLAFSAKDYEDVKVNSYGQFTTSIVAVILRLHNRPHYVSEKRLKFQEWKY